MIDDQSEKKLIAILNKVIKKTKITSDTLQLNLSEHGMDSVMFIQIIVAIEEAFSCEIPDTKLLIPEMNTPQKILDVLKTVLEEGGT